MLSIESIRKQCEAEILHQNTQYSQAMKALFEQHMNDAVVTKAYDELQRQIKAYPSAQSYEALIRIPLGDIFTDTLKRDDDGATPPRSPLCVYFRNPEGKVSAIKLTHNIESSSRNAFQDYLYTADPTVQAFRAFLHSKFPGAILRPFLYGYMMLEPPKFEVSITYKVPLSPDFPLAKALMPYRKYEGDFVYWHEPEVKK